MDNSVIQSLNKWAESFLGKTCFPGDLRYILSSAKGMSRRDNKITTYIFYKDEKNPIGVAKTSIVGDYSLLTHQYNQIDRLGCMGIEDVLIPKPLAVFSTGEYNFYIESFVEGKTLNYRYSQDVSNFHKAILWLTKFHQMTKSDNKKMLKIRMEEWINIIIESRFLSSSMNSYVKKLTPKIEKFMNDIPTVFMHGDYHLGQILQTPSAKIGVIDWEYSLSYGAPVLDLIEFLVLAGVLYGIYPTINDSFYALFYDINKQTGHKKFHLWVKEYTQNYFDCLGLNKSDLSKFLMLFILYNLVRTIDLRGNVLLVDDIADRIKLLESFSQKETISW